MMIPPSRGETLSLKPAACNLFPYYVMAPLITPLSPCYALSGRTDFTSFMAFLDFILSHHSLLPAPKLLIVIISVNPLISPEYFLLHLSCWCLHTIPCVEGRLPSLLSWLSRLYTHSLFSLAQTFDFRYF